MRVRSLLLASLSLPALSCAEQVEYELNGGEIQLLDPADVHETQRAEEGSPITGQMLVRDLFARQRCSAPGINVLCGDGCCPNSESCCDNTSCGDPAQRICCRGGHQCPIGGDCCSDGNCCRSGYYCVKNLSTGQIGCRRYGGGSSATTVTTTSLSTSTSSYTSTYTASPSFVPTCENSGYDPCPDEQFCCPSGDYCYYDAAGNPKCWSGNGFYYWYYYYYWYYEEYTTTLWFTTSTSYYLGAFSTVFKFPSTPPTPSVEPPTSLAIVPPSNTAELIAGGGGGGGGAMTATASSNADGNLPEGSLDSDSATLPSPTLLATYTYTGLASSSTTSSATGATETLSGTGGVGGSGGDSGGSLFSAGTKEIDMMWTKETTLGLLGVVGIFVGVVLL